MGITQPAAVRGADRQVGVVLSRGKGLAEISREILGWAFDGLPRCPAREHRRFVRPATNHENIPAYEASRDASY
jgi:hypothetical protein